MGMGTQKIKYSEMSQIWEQMREQVMGGLG